MSLELIYYNFLILWTTIAVVVFFTLFYKNASYGRFFNIDSSYTVSSRAGWIIMESPAVIGILLFLIWFYKDIGLTEIIFSLIWLSHYIHRTLIWPLRAKLKGKKMTISVILMALLFNTVNITLQCIWIFIISSYNQDWVFSSFFIGGLLLFYIGMLINIKSDNILMKLRRDQDQGYHVPQGFLYKYLSCPNYFGEIIEWIGWALLTMSPAGLVFFIWTVANLVPRAKSNLQWSKANIPNYPLNRKAIFPFIY